MGEIKSLHGLAIMFTSFLSSADYYTQPLKKCGVSQFYHPFKKLRSSVRPSVRPSVRQRIVLLLGTFLTNFLQTCYESWGRSVLGLHMGKLWQISTEVQPLMDVRNWFSLSSFGIPIPIFFKLGMGVDIVKECSRIADR